MPKVAKLTPFDDALHQIVSDASLVGVERLPIVQCRGAVLAEEIRAGIDVPPVDNSAMDGYALRALDARDGQPLLVSQRIPAGQVATPLMPGTAARIFTGAPVPPGADCVVAQEDCQRDGDHVQLSTQPSAGQHIRRRGEDIARGQTVLSAGQRLGAAQLGLLASLGIDVAPVRRPFKVALMCTGDELREPGQAIELGQIYNSNRPMLAALLAGLGMDVVDMGIVGDSPEATRQALTNAAAAADVVVSSGGVSVGEEDHVKSQVEALGWLSLWKLAIKPGKPLAYGKIVDTPFFGLPGNPVSSFVTFCLLVRPYLLSMLGDNGAVPSAWPVSADFDWPKSGSRQEYARARLSGEGGRLSASLYPHQGSGVLSSVAWCDALVVIPPGTTVSRGDTVSAIPMSALD